MTDVKKTFFLFPGQGAQYPGMGLDFFETGLPAVRALFETASEAAGRDMAAALRDEEALKRTDVSQPAVTLVNLAAAAFLAEKGVTPSGCAGHSLGEYAALASSGVVSAEDCLFLAARRGEAMQAAADRLREESGGAALGWKVPSAFQPGMLAVIGLPPEQIEALVAEWQAAPPLDALFAANFNSVRQTVVSGTAAALEEAEKRFTAAGARRVVPLAVAGPFHSPLMAGAAEAFRPFLEKISFNDPVCPFYSNVTGRPVTSGGEAKKLAFLQITSPVRWTDEEAAIQAAGGFEVCLETGPGKVLRGLWKDTNAAAPCLGAGTVEEIEEIEGVTHDELAG